MKKKKENQSYNSLHYNKTNIINCNFLLDKYFINFR